jgi:hypothetical protein
MPHASATTDRIAFDAVGYDPMADRALSGFERIENIAGGTVGYAGTWVPLAYPIRVASGAPKGAVSQLSPYALNRSHNICGRASSRNVAGIAESMRANGWQGGAIQAVEHNGRLYVIDGHHRLYAAKLVGLQVVPVEVTPFRPRIGSWQSLDELLHDASVVAPDRIR